MRHLLTLSLALGLGFSAPDLAAKTAAWTLDPSHTEIGFETTHLGVTKVRGRFTEAKASIKLDEKDLTKSQVEATIPVRSVTTANERRDQHLLNDDFFAADKHPEIRFKSTRIAKDGDGYAVTGDLSIRGVTKPVVLKAQVSEAFEGPWGGQKRGFSLRGEIDRFDYGVAWGNKTKAGNLVVAPKVQLIIDGQLDRK